MATQRRRFHFLLYSHQAWLCALRRYFCEPIYLAELDGKLFSLIPSSSIDVSLFELQRNLAQIELV